MGVFKNDDLLLSCSSKSLKSLYINIYPKQKYYTQSSMDSMKITVQTILLLIKSGSSLNIIVTHLEYS